MTSWIKKFPSPQDLVFGHAS